AEIFQVVHLELTRPIGLVPRLAGLIGVFDRSAVMHVLAAATTRDRGPEIIQNVAMETDALAGRKRDHPYPHTLALRDQRAADARVGVLGLALEFRLDLRRPRALVRANRGF